MSTPKTSDEAGRVAAAILRRAMPGRPSKVRAECDRAERLAKAIWNRWQAGPWQWQCKHVRWFLEHDSRYFTAWTRYRYWLTVERVLRATGKLDCWLVYLNGPWRSPRREQ